LTANIGYSVFTKPWKTALPELGAFVKKLGFDAIELPVRPGYQVEPENVEKGLPRAAAIMADCGVRIGSIAGPTDERTIAACAEARVPLIRICVAVKGDYLKAEEETRRDFDRLLPHLEAHGVAIGVQNHCGLCVCNAMGVRSLIGKYSPRHVCAVWDPMHCALEGEQPELAADILWSHLRLVNLKNAFRQRVSGPEAAAEWKIYCTTGRHGFASWPRVAAILKERAYRGDVCLTAEYADAQAVDRLIAEDIAFAKSLFA
jgi:sugar phosphate isomerase/epimerase